MNAGVDGVALRESLCDQRESPGDKLRPGRGRVVSELTIRFIALMKKSSVTVRVTNMDLPQIGAHCSLSACNILDFLPIKCRCDKLYCSAHINPDHHACRASSTISLSPNINTDTELHAVCVLDGCKKASLSREETCSACHRSFCVECIFHLI